MRKLIINNIEAVLEKTASIKLVNENPNITRSDTYTYELRLPINADNNRILFGSLDMSCTSFKDINYPGILLFDTYQLKGELKILSIEKGVLSAQFLTGSALLNSKRNLFIDELPLYDIKQDFNNYIDELISYGQTVVYNDIKMYNFNFRVKEKFICTPSYDTANDMNANVIYSSSHINYNPSIGWPINSSFRFNCAPMPRLGFLLKRVFEELGYTLTSNFLENTVFSKIYVMSSTISTKIEDGLPHWTVAKFMNEVENLFNCTFLFKNNEVSIIPNTDYFKLNPITLDNVISSFTKKKNETDESKTTGNILSYNLVDNYNNKWDKLSQEFLDHAKLIEINDPDSYFKTNVPGIEFNYVLNQLGTQFFNIYNEQRNTHYPLALNCFRNYSSPKAVDQLNIVPVTIGQDEAGFPNLANQAQGINPSHVNRDIPYLDGNNQKSSYHNIQKMVDGDENVEEIKKNTVMQIAFFQENDSDSESGSNLKYERYYDQVYTVARRTSNNIESGSLLLNKPNKVTYQNGFYQFDKLATIYEYDYPSLELYPRPRGTAPSIGNLHLVDHHVDFDDKVEVHFTFISSYIPDIRHIFIIDNKKYVAKQISIVIENDGLQHIFEGDFYEVKS